jgi:hypothetical protein
MSDSTWRGVILETISTGYSLSSVEKGSRGIRRRVELLLVRCWVTGVRARSRVLLLPSVGESSSSTGIAASLQSPSRVPAHGFAARVPRRVNGPCILS